MADTEDRSSWTGQEFWDARYAAAERIWSGRPNAALVKEVTALAPGRALDLGCGEGGDAIWLARRGWRVTGTDISGVALERAAAHAAAEGVGERISWERHDLGESFPAGEFDLVSAAFLHSWGEMPRERILRRAAGAVAAGGVLLIVGHAGHPHREGHDDHPRVPLPDPAEVLAGLELPAGAWEVLRQEEYERQAAGPDGEPGVRRDNTVLARRVR